MNAIETFFLLKLTRNYFQSNLGMQAHLFSFKTHDSLRYLKTARFVYCYYMSFPLVIFLSHVKPWYGEENISENCVFTNYIHTLLRIRIAVGHFKIRNKKLKFFGLSLSNK